MIQSTRGGPTGTSLTVEDLRRADGTFQHVSLDSRPLQSGPRLLAYRGVQYGGKLTVAGHKWRGPSRATPEEAAQDYLDYLGGTAAPRYPDLPSGNVRPRKGPKGGKRRTTKPKQPIGPGFIYLMARSMAPEAGDPVTIGSSGTLLGVQHRLSDHQRANERKLHIVATMQTDDRSTERAIRERYDPKGMVGEWRPYSDELHAEFD